MIVGAVSVSASNSVGADVGILIDNDVVKTTVGTSGQVEIEAEGDYAQAADVEKYTQMFSISAAAGKKNTVGGSINVIVSNGEAKSETGSSAAITAGGNIGVLANTAEDLLLVSAAASVSTQGGVAVGGNVDVIVNRAATKAIVGAGAQLAAGGDLSVHAKVDVFGVAVAGGAAAGKGHSIAGAIGVLVTKSNTLVDIGNGASLSAEEGDLSLKAKSDSLMVNAILSTSVSLGGAGIGATVNVDVFKRDVNVKTQNATLSAGGNISSQTHGKDSTVLVTAAVGAAKGIAVAGSIPVTVANNKLKNTNGGALRATAGGSIGVESDYRYSLVDAAGGIGISLNGVAVGATVSTAVINNTVQTTLGDASILRAAAKHTLNTNGAGETAGIYIGATASERLILASLSVSGSLSSAAVADVTLRSTQENLLFDVIRGEETNLRLAAEQNIAPLHELSPVISFHDRVYDGDETPIDTPNNASLTLNAGLDIGTEAHQLYVDVPEELTVRIERVRNLFLTALKADETGVPERLTWDNSTLSYSEADGKLVVDETAFRVAYSEGEGVILAGDLENTDGEEYYSLVIPELQEENLPDWFLERSRAIYADGEDSAWTYLVNENVDLEAYVLAPYLSVGLDKDGLADDELEAAIEAEYGAAFLAAAIAAVEDGECETLQEFVLKATLASTGEIENEALAALCDEASELIYYRVYEEGWVDSYTDEDDTRTSLDRKTQILRIIGRDWDYATALAGEIRETVNGFADPTVVETESLDTWLLTRSHAVYGDEEAVAWTYLVPATEEELEALILAPYRRQGDGDA